MGICGDYMNALAGYNKAVTNQYQGDVLIITSKEGVFSETRGKCHSRVKKDAQDKYKQHRLNNM